MSCAECGARYQASTRCELSSALRLKAQAAQEQRAPESLMSRSGVQAVGPLPWLAGAPRDTVCACCFCQLTVDADDAQGLCEHARARLERLTVPLQGRNIQVHLCDRAELHRVARCPITPGVTLHGFHECTSARCDVYLLRGCSYARSYSTMLHELWHFSMHVMGWHKALGTLFGARICAHSGLIEEALCCSVSATLGVGDKQSELRSVKWHLDNIPGGARTVAEAIRGLLSLPPRAPTRLRELMAQVEQRLQL